MKSNISNFIKLNTIEKGEGSMGRKDMSQSDFFADKSRFSDLFNGIIFQGEPVIKAEELEVEDSVVTWRGGSKAKK